MSRRLALLFAVVALGLAGLVVWRFLQFEGLVEVEPRGPDRRVLKPARFTDLPGWREDAVAEALPALLRSCSRFSALPDDETVGEIGGRAGDWRPVCEAAARVPPGDSAAARAVFEAGLRPFAVRNRLDPRGLFTGYYEPLLQGSRQRRGAFQVPIYRRPEELVMVDLGRFREELAGQRIAGRVVEGTLVPFQGRGEIEEGALAGRGLELAWVDDPIDSFFLHIQGSGRIALAEGGELRVGYAGQNGHPYLAIGKELVDRGALRREEVSMQSIRRWLEENPAQAPEVMRKNASYVFFQEIEGEGPLGAQGVPLTPGRSLAVDRKYIPLGVPVWLAGAAPSPKEGEPDRPLRRLLVAQDTGGAIRGPVRGDVFWGHGEEAAAVAGRMKHPGRLWVLLPKSVDPRRIREQGEPASGRSDRAGPSPAPPG